jgi:serine/threonine-protein kinase
MIPFQSNVLGIMMFVVAALIAGALHAAWAGTDESGTPLRMLHRDLKPANLMLTPLGAVKICDLGIAATAEDARGCTFGTPDYAAPERFDGREGPEADVYALAVVLYELITGERFGLGTPVREHHEARWREVLAVLRARLPASGRAAEPVYDLIRFSLAFDPSVRPPADAFEAACLAVAGQLREEPLRSWAAREVGPLLAEALEPEVDDEDLVAEVVVDDETPTLMDLSKDAGLRA